jgi:hypothetical protein
MAFPSIVALLRDRILPNENTAHYAKLALDMILDNGHLYFVDKDNDYRFRLVVPPVYRDRLYSDVHSRCIGEHCSESAIYSILKKQYYWPDMRIEIRKRCRTCVECTNKVCVH